MQNYVNGPEIPLGLGMALAQNGDALTHFAALSAERKQEIIEHTHGISSKNEMRAFVNSIASSSFV